MKTFKQLLDETIPDISELFPWDAEDFQNDNPDMLCLDIREPYEFESVRIRDSINVPRGILESACEYDYEETVPELVNSRQRPVLIVCRSGNRSIFAAKTMQDMGFKNTHSLKTGLKGWNDFDLPLVDANDNDVDADDADIYFTPNLRPEQLRPKN